MSTTAPVRQRRAAPSHAPTRRSTPVRPKVAPAPQRRKAAPRRRPVAKIAAVGIVLTAVFVVVAGQTIVAQGQISLAHTRAQVQAAETAHREAMLKVARLETPTKVASAAASTLHLVQPSSVVDLPAVPLDQPLAPPRITPAPPGSPAPVVLAPIAPPGSAPR